MKRKRIFSICLALALCLGLLPAPALAAGSAPDTLIVGNQTITSEGYWTTDDAGTLSPWTGAGSPGEDASYVHYDPDAADGPTLILHGAKIEISSRDIIYR